MTHVNIRPRRDSVIGRQTSFIDTSKNRQSKQQTPVKVLVFNSKCSEIFKSTLEDCVEECILQFPGENSIYVPKSGQAIRISTSSKETPSLSLKEGNSNENQLARSNRRKSSVTQFNLPPISKKRSGQASIFPLPKAVPAVASAFRMRHQLVQKKFSFTENISEEATDNQTDTEQAQNIVTTEFNVEHPSTSQEDTLTRQSNLDTLSQSLSAYRKFTSASSHISYRDRRKDYRLSDLVMLGPEYFTHAFNLKGTSRYAVQTSSKHRSNTKQKGTKQADKKNSELDQIKQDLFHRYLWTQKPQVSCRIRPIPTYPRSTTFVF